MKKFLTTMSLCIAFAMAAVAQVPNTMMYQVLVLDPSTGKIKANQNATIRVELHQESAAGTIVWSQNYNVTTSNSGICNLALNFSDDIDWNDGPYYMATLIDGVKAGAPQVTSVPYALEAKTLEGVITKKDILGRWEQNVNSHAFWTFIVFNENGAGSYGDDYDTYHFTYTVDAAGNIFVIRSDGAGQIYHATKRSNNELFIGSDSGVIYTKQ